MTFCDPMDCSMSDFPVSHQLLELAQTHVHRVVIPSSHLAPCKTFLLLPSVFPSIRVFSNESAHCIRWLKYWSFSISPFNDHSGLISFKIDWFYLLAIQGPVKSLLQHHSSKASILQCSAFFMIQLSLPYMTIGRTLHSLITLTVNFQCKHILFSGHGFQQHQVKWQNIKYYFIRH